MIDLLEIQDLAGGWRWCEGLRCFTRARCRVRYEMDGEMCEDVLCGDCTREIEDRAHVNSGDNQGGPTSRTGPTRPTAYSGASLEGKEVCG